MRLLPLYMEVDGLRGILVAYLAGSTVVHQDPYPRLDLAEFVDVGISEHTAKVCDASRTTELSPCLRARPSPNMENSTWSKDSLPSFITSRI
jgi:hypothetical protein